MLTTEVKYIAEGMEYEMNFADKYALYQCAYYCYGSLSKQEALLFFNCKKHMLG